MPKYNIVAIHSFCGGRTEANKRKNSFEECLRMFLKCNIEKSEELSVFVLVKAALLISKLRLF